MGIFSALFNSGTTKTTLAADDMFAVTTSTAKNVAKKLSWTNLKVAIKAYCDTLYASGSAYVHPTTDGNKHVLATSTTNNGKVLTAGSSAGVFTWEAVPAVATTPVISTGTSAPATTPGKAGDMFVDTSAKKLYIATAATASTDWTLVGPA